MILVGRSFLVERNADANKCFESMVLTHDGSCSMVGI